MLRNPSRRTKGSPRDRESLCDGNPVPARDCAREDGAFMEQSGRNQWQPVASARSPKMVRRGSTVRVRQRALHKPRKSPPPDSEVPLGGRRECGRVGSVPEHRSPPRPLQTPAGAAVVVWFVTRPETDAPMPHDWLANPSSEELNPPPGVRRPSLHADRRTHPRARLPAESPLRSRRYDDEHPCSCSRARPDGVSRCACVPARRRRRRRRLAGGG
jgi:hypothetical protein